jgi:adenylate cyclase
MPAWTWDYVWKLQSKLDDITDKLDDRLDDVTAGRIAPAIDDITIGSGRRVSAAILFFDISGFSSLTSSADDDQLKKTLYMLDCVIPMTMQVVFDHGGYVEKNTGDGVMAIIGAGETTEVAVNAALSIATISFYVLNKLVNPHLASVGIDPVEAKIGIDHGDTVLARIGLPTGNAKHHRNFITAVGPTANIASKLEDCASAGQILVGDQIRSHAWENREQFFSPVSISNWTWIYVQSGAPYQSWHYDAFRKDPTA